MAVLKYHELCVNVAHHPRPLVASVVELEMLCVALATFLRGYAFEVDDGPKAGIVVRNWPADVDVVSPVATEGTQGGMEGMEGMEERGIEEGGMEEGEGRGEERAESAHKSFSFVTSNSFAHVGKGGDRHATFPLSRRNVVALALVTRGGVPRFTPSEVGAIRLAFGFVFGQQMVRSGWKFVVPKL